MLEQFTPNFHVENKTNWDSNKIFLIEKCLRLLLNAFPAVNLYKKIFLEDTQLPNLFN